MIRRRAPATSTPTSTSSSSASPSLLSAKDTTTSTTTTTTTTLNEKITAGVFTFVWRTAIMVLMGLIVVVLLLHRLPFKTGSVLRGGGGGGKRHKVTLDQLRASAPQLQGSLRSLRQEFEQQYGGEAAGQELLERGLKTFGSLEAAARQWIRLAVGGNDWQMSFGGYSVTVGRGNLFHESFPKVMEGLLGKTLATTAPVFPTVRVRNHAIGGIPSFPYGWCLSEFLGTDSHVVSWDYGMNEGKDVVAFESYLRHALVLPERPVFVMVDDFHKGRLHVLQQYYDHDDAPWGHAVVLTKAEAAMGPITKAFLALEEESQRPPGFQQWKEWGSPPGSPGQSPWHPKKKQHELMGWMLTMHFVQVMEHALQLLSSSSLSFATTTEATTTTTTTMAESSSLLPKPVTPLPAGATTERMSSLLYGVPTQGAWRMNSVSCRTSFWPTVSSENLQSMVQSGLKVDSDAPLLDNRPASDYQGHWVADVGKVERDTKRKVLAKDPNGFGYMDRKVALYGIPASQTLTLQLPPPSPVLSHLHSIVLCEVNEKRTPQECRMNVDVEYQLGTTPLTDIAPARFVAEYLRKQICWVLTVPKTTKSRTLKVTVTGTNVTLASGPCSISHVIWQDL